jgi:phage terminase small subunit
MDTNTLTPQREAFAQAVATGKGLSDAYRHSYQANRMKPETINKRASELMGNGAITGRVAALRAEAAERAVLTIGAHLEKLANLRDEAQRDGKYGPAIQAEIARGRAAGLYVERAELTGKNGGPLNMPQPKLEISLTLSDEELERIARGKTA